MVENINTLESEVNIQDIAEVLKAQGLDIRELAKQAKLLKTTPTPTPKTSSPTVKKENSFELVLVNYPDFVIEKRMATVTKRVVIMPSCDGYYLKTIPNNRPNESSAEILSADLYVSFAQGMEDIDMPEDFWVNKIKSGKRFYNDMNTYLKTEGMIDMIKNHCAQKMRISSSENDLYENKKIYKERVKTYLANRILNIEFSKTDKTKAKYMLDHASYFVKGITDKFGLNNARDFLNAFEDSLITAEQVPCFQHARWDRTVCGGCVYTPNIPDCEMQYSSFKDYILYGAVHMGYANNMRHFFVEWGDSIEMQKLLYNKIKEKYSLNLPTIHHQLSYQAELRKAEIDAVKFEIAASKAKAYEYKNSKYCILAPTKKEDFSDEAIQQANCVAGYVDKFAEEKSVVLFMRKTDDVEHSLVTIEVCDGIIRQAYQARNTRITEVQREFINEWAKEKDIKVNI